jgi:hypothetical protein
MANAVDGITHSRLKERDKSLFVYAWLNHTLFLIVAFGHKMLPNWALAVDFMINAVLIRNSEGQGTGVNVVSCICKQL